MKPKKERKCKQCKQYFMPERTYQNICSEECAVDWAEAVAAKIKRREARQAKVDYNWKSRPWLLKQAQKAVNEYIRLRDRNEPCISCGASSGFRVEAGHYRSSGNNSAIRFHTLNIWAQDHKCNCHMSANLVPYRENLIKKIGLERVEWLESQTQPKKYEIEYLHKLIRVFRKKNKFMKKRYNIKD